MSYPRYYVIQRIGTTDFWSNNAGWTSLNEATVFIEQEVQKLNVPLDGIWVEDTREMIPGQL